MVPMEIFILAAYRPRLRKLVDRLERKLWYTELNDEAMMPAINTHVTISIFMTTPIPNTCTTLYCTMNHTQWKTPPARTAASSRQAAHRCLDPYLQDAFNDEHGANFNHVIFA